MLIRVTSPLADNPEAMLLEDAADLESRKNPKLTQSGPRFV